MAPGQDGDLLMQMDIEGAERDVLAAVSDTLLKRFRIIVIEFRQLEHVFDWIGFERFSTVFNQLSKFHEVVHIHPNNAGGSAWAGDLGIPKLLEITYYRRDRSNFRTDAALTFPHPLDVPNLPTKNELALPKCWYA
jgi:Methyltransferase FkbM domain